MKDKPATCTISLTHGQRGAAAGSGSVPAEDASKTGASASNTRSLLKRDRYTTSSHRFPVKRDGVSVAKALSLLAGDVSPLSHYGVFAAKALSLAKGDVSPLSCYGVSVAETLSLATGDMSPLSRYGVSVAEALSLDTHNVCTFSRYGVFATETRELVCGKLRPKKFGHYAVAIYSKRGTGGWELLAISTASPYEDERPLLVPGQPEIREYKMRFWDDGTENGDWTDVATVTVSV